MIEAFHAAKKGAPLTPFSYEAKSPELYQIRVKITHCGICHSDLHLIDNDWGITNYPLVPGHEIIGIVEEKGDHAFHLEVGDRVGIGWQGKSCMACNYCLQGEENMCKNQEATCVAAFGGFATHIIADSRFAFPIPEEISSAEAAPLLCGGATVFSPFLTYEIGPTAHVAILGIGGLGHLALQFAHAMGCEVTALSHSPEKEKEARELGADHFVCTKDPAIFETLTRRFDFILSSATTGLDWDPLLTTLAPRGKLCLLGAKALTAEIPIMRLIDCSKSVCGSNIGSRPSIKKMLDFAALHNIRPKIERFPLREVNTALDKLRANKMRYRAVLEM